MRHLFIINPCAGKGMDVDGLVADITAVMKDSSDEWKCEITKAAGDAEKLARAASESSSELLRVYAIGGDGTLNEVINGAAGYAHVSVGVCPLGSGNDFVKTFGKISCFLNLKEMTTSPSYPMDLIDCDGRLSVNICSVGFDCRVGTEMSNYKHLPLVSGKGTYIISLVVNFIRGIAQYYEMELDGEKISGKYSMMAICNGQYYGGGFRPVPEARPNDGVLDFVLVKKVSRLRLLTLVGKYSSGKGKDYPQYIRMQRGTTLRIYQNDDHFVNIDGERFDSDAPIFTLSDKKVSFIVPRSTGWKA